MGFAIGLLGKYRCENRPAPVFLYKESDSDSIEFAKERLRGIGYYDEKKGLIPWEDDKEANSE